MRFFSPPPKYHPASLTLRHNLHPIIDLLHYNRDLDGRHHFLEESNGQELKEAK
jgi:hypothetical protein